MACLIGQGGRGVRAMNLSLHIADCSTPTSNGTCTWYVVATGTVHSEPFFGAFQPSVFSMVANTGRSPDISVPIPGAIH